MKRKAKNQKEPPSAPGSAPGQAVTPDDALPPTEGEPPTENEPQVIPIGVPVPSEEWRKLKSQAEKPDPSPHQTADKPDESPGANADEDEPEA